MAKTGTEVTPARGSLERMPRALSPFSNIDRLFDDLISSRFPRAFGWDQSLAQMPSVDVIDREDEVCVRAEVPGYRKEDIEISVSGDMVTLKGETGGEQKEDKDDYYYREISRGSFARTIQLPADVDDQKAKATMKDGVLELRLPKVEKSKRRTISIS